MDVLGCLRREIEEMWRKWDKWNAKMFGFCHVHAGVTCDLSISFSVYRDLSIMQLIWFESGDAILFYATRWRSFVYVRFCFDIWRDTEMWRKGNISGTCIVKKNENKYCTIFLKYYFFCYITSSRYIVVLRIWDMTILKILKGKC